MKHYLLPLALVLALTGGASAQTITKSLQGSPDPRGPVGIDSLTNLYFPNHVNPLGNLGIAPTTSCTSGSATACGAQTGTDNAGTVVTSGTALTVTFGQAFVVAPSCLLQEQAGTVAPTFTDATTGILATVVVTAKTYNWLCFSPQ